MKITHDKNIFAKNVPKDETILMPRNGSVSNVFLPNFLIYVCNVLKEENNKKKLDNSSLDEFIHYLTEPIYIMDGSNDVYCQLLRSIKMTKM